MSPSSLRWSAAVLALTLPGSAGAFWLNFHDNIARQALESLFDEHTLWSTSKYDTATDIDEADLHEAHFDSESFAASGDRLQDLLEGSVDLAAQCNKKDAVMVLGKALHGLQDFYAHSSWVDRKCTGAEIPVNTAIFDMSNPASTLQCDLTVGPGSTPTLYTSGYYPDPTAPSGKCSHGQLNKDAIFVNVPKYGSPRGATMCQGERLHAWAKDVARRHTSTTYDYLVNYTVVTYPWAVDQILDYLMVDQVSAGLVAERSGASAAVARVLQEHLALAGDRGGRPDLTVSTLGADGAVLAGPECSPARVEARLASLADLRSSSTPAKGSTAAGILQVLGHHQGLGGAVVVVSSEGAMTPAERRAISVALEEAEMTLQVLWTGQGGPGALGELARASGGQLIHLPSRRGDVEAAARSLIQSLDPDLDLAAVGQGPGEVKLQADGRRVVVAAWSRDGQPVELRATASSGGAPRRASGVWPTLELEALPQGWTLTTGGAEADVRVYVDGRAFVLGSRVVDTLREEAHDHIPDLPGAGDTQLRVGYVRPGSVTVTAMDQGGQDLGQLRSWPTEVGQSQDVWRLSPLPEGTRWIKLEGLSDEGVAFTRVVPALP